MMRLYKKKVLMVPEIFRLVSIVHRCWFAFSISFSPFFSLDRVGAFTDRNSIYAIFININRAEVCTHVTSAVEVNLRVHINNVHSKSER